MSARLLIFCFVLISYVIVLVYNFLFFCVLIKNKSWWKKWKRVLNHVLNEMWYIENHFFCKWKLYLRTTWSIRLCLICRRRVEKICYQNKNETVFILLKYLFSFLLNFLKIIFHFNLNWIIKLDYIVSFKY